MSYDLRKQIYNNLIIKETEDLLEIWLKGDINEWKDDVFEIVKEILLERLGYLPPQSVQIQITQLGSLGNAVI